MLTSFVLHQSFEFVQAAHEYICVEIERDQQAWESPQHPERTKNQVLDGKTTREIKNELGNEGSITPGNNEIININVLAK